MRKSLNDHLDKIEKQTVEEMISKEQHSIQLLLQDWYCSAFLQQIQHQI
jgi:hypothetical protein